MRSAPFSQALCILFWVELVFSGKTGRGFHRVRGQYTRDKVEMQCVLWNGT
jgi:hypothetical protein